MKTQDIKRKEERRKERREQREMQRKRKLYTALWITLAVVAALGLACLIYFTSYYHADADAIAAYVSDTPILQKTLEDGTMVFEPLTTPVAGLVFYPGGKVEASSYIPLMLAMADKGILCVLVEMPLHLAVFDVDAADGMQQLYPEVKNWYIGGHSLGGSMAASYLSQHAEDYAGLLLLGSYSAIDLSDLPLDALSIVGSEDGVLNREKYEACIENLPAGAREYVIDGGCHAYFGMYGEQRGDGVPTITVKEQIKESAEAFYNFVLATK